MKFIELTRPSAAENVALDEALLIQAEQSDRPLEYLRIWEPTGPMVVVGRASKIAEEANLAACEAEGVPVFRRCSGGAAIVAMPGCLMYAVVLSINLRPQLAAIDRAHRFVLGQLAEAISSEQLQVSVRGISDLAIANRKFSGNSLRCKRTHVLYHGTLLYNGDLLQISRLLGTPPRQPEYRKGRSHDAFIANLPIERDVLSAAVRTAFPADTVDHWPEELTRQLVAEKYRTDAWNHRF